MGEIWLTSDWHFNHDREFVFKPRGFDNVGDMNRAIIQRHNELVLPDDDVYILGDLMLGGPDIEKGLSLITQLKGKLHVIRGNHDTDTRINAYPTCWNIIDVQDALYLKYKKYHFFLTHYPCYTGNLEKESLHQMTLNLSGHTHSKNKFYNNLPFIYNVACDAHNCCPVNINQIIQDMNEEVENCKFYL